MKKIRAIVIGVGQMGKFITKLMTEKGVEIVGAVNVKRHIGEDLGSVCGLNEPLGVEITDDLESLISAEPGIDIAVHAACSYMDGLYADARRCLEQGINVLTITEGAFYPWTYDPETATELDKVAKAHNVTLTASGVQDVYWVNLIAMLTAGSHRIDTLEAECVANFDGFGPALLNNLPLGITPEQFLASAPPAGQKPPPSTVGMGMEALISALDMNIKSIDIGVEPVTSDSDVHCNGLDRVLKAGEVIGVNEKIEIVTVEGPKFRADFTAKIFGEEDVETNIWNIKGVPNIHMQQDNFPGWEITCTTVVNRIPDILNAEPGFITAEKLAPSKYRALPMEHYVKV